MVHRWALFVTSLALATTPAGSAHGQVDADGDGFPVPQDCDDSDPMTYPGAPEDCDSYADHNCDGVIESQTPACDHDGDGWIIGQDCDDFDATVWPGAPELCDAKDNNCDGQVDEGCTNVELCTNGVDDDANGLVDCLDPFCSAHHWCIDDDGDGFSEGLGDCDDMQPLRYPGATEECDCIDNDCNGLTDDGCVPPQATVGSWWPGFALCFSDASLVGEEDYDYSGSAIAAAGDVDGDGFPDLVIGARNNNGEGDGRGQVYLVLGKASGWAMDQDLGTSDVSFVGEPDAGGSARAVAGVGDVDGNGLADLLISSEYSSQSAIAGGETYLLLSQGGAGDDDTGDDDTGDDDSGDDDSGDDDTEDDDTGDDDNADDAGGATGCECGHRAPAAGAGATSWALSVLLGVVIVRRAAKHDLGS